MSLLTPLLRCQAERGNTRLQTGGKATLFIKWQRTWSHCFHIFMGCGKEEFVREEAGWGNPREVLNKWPGLWLCFCYCFLCTYSKIPEERNGFNQNGSSKKKPTESLETPQTVCIERLGRPVGRESTRRLYDHGDRKHISQPSPVVQDPQRQLRTHHSCSSHQTPRGQRAWLQGATSKLGNSHCGPYFVPALWCLIL